MDFSRGVGRVLGLPLAPVLAAGSALRRARVFHPDGRCWHARAQALDAGPLQAVADALAGPVCARFSAGTWRDEPPLPDILGVALRFGTSWGAPGPDELDLLFCTFRSVWQIPVALLTTDASDFLRNTLWAGVPFRVGGRRAGLRLSPAREPAGHAGRYAALRAVADGRPAFRLEAEVEGGVHPLVAVVLERELEDAPGTLRFAPHRGARGVEPVGWLTGMRAWAYPLSQAARGATR